MAKPPNGLVPLDPGGSASVPDQQLGLRQLEGLIERTRAMVQYIDNVTDATALVRRAGATEKLVTEALRSCRLLEDEQFSLRQAATEAHLRTQRRAGELLMRLAKHRGGRRRETGDIVQEVDGQPLTLKQLGIRSHESHRWQRIAALPDESFDAIIREARDRRTELTTTRVLAQARRLVAGSWADDEFTRAARNRHVLDLFRRQVRVLVSTDLTQLASVLEQQDTSAELDQLSEDVGELGAWLHEVECLLAKRRALPIAESDAAEGH